MTVLKIKKQKAQKCVSYKENLNLKIINCLEATELEGKIKCLEENKIKYKNHKIWNHKKFIRNNKSTLKTQQRFKSEGHNVFTEEINNNNKFKWW